MNFGVASVVLIQFPFSDLALRKQRPALLLSHVRKIRALDLVIVAMITSQIDAPKLIGDVLLEDWKKAGLLHPSRIRLAKIATVDASLVRSDLGNLSERDQRKARKAFQNVFPGWV